MKNEKEKLIEKLEKFADNYGMLECTDIVIGYSGGADSSLLLYILTALQKKRDFHIHAAHINHMFRGEEADRDEDFCRQTCKRLSIPFYSLKADVAALARKRGESDEQCARDVRYGFFSEIKEKLDKSGAHVHIATAHNATDNAETVIFNLSRGTAISGVCGIPPMRDGHIIRPILPLSKEEVLLFCDTLGIEYVTDRTNKQTCYTRNKIRHNVISVLREINPSLEVSILRATESIRADAEYLSAEAASAYEKICDGRFLFQDSFTELSSVISSRVLCMFLEQNGAGFEHIHIKACLEKISDGADFSLSLIGKKKLLMERGCISVAEDLREKKTSIAWEITLREGKNTLPDGSQIYLFSKKERIERIKTQNVYKLFIQQTLSGDTISNAFVARSRKDGDTLKSGGHTHKVKKLLSDKKLPSCEREQLPMILRDGEIVWIPNVRVADGEGKGESGHIFCVYIKQ